MNRPHLSQMRPIFASSPGMRRILDHSRKVARTSYPVLIHGETGTGKDLLARELHAASGRSGQFVAINCGALPDGLVEAELFGAKRGAYTGLDVERRGLFRLAEGGTLFLDEIGDMPTEVQTKLLRILQDGEIRSLGASACERVDVRIILATHRDLAEMVERREFRRDLYYRISTVLLSLPPLRNRREDIVPLLRMAVLEAAQHQQVPMPQISDEVIHRALEYPWPGNIREMFQAAASAVLNARDGILTVEDFRVLDRRRPASAGSDLERPFFEALDDFEREYLTALLRATDGNLTKAAQKAQLSRSALRAKAHRYGLLGAGDACAPESPARSRVRRGKGEAGSGARGNSFLAEDTIEPSRGVKEELKAAEVE